MKISKIFNFYKKDGSTILAMTKGLQGFTDSEEFQVFIKEKGFELTEQQYGDHVNEMSRREVKISPMLNSTNKQELADIAVNTASRKIVRSQSLVAAVDHTDDASRRIAIAM